MRALRREFEAVYPQLPVLLNEKAPFSAHAHVRVRVRARVRVRVLARVLARARACVCALPFLPNSASPSTLSPDPRRASIPSSRTCKLAAARCTTLPEGGASLTSMPNGCHRGQVSDIVRIRVLVRFPMQSQMVCLFAFQTRKQTSYHPAMYATCINVLALSLTDARHKLSTADERKRMSMLTNTFARTWRPKSLAPTTLPIRSASCATDSSPPCPHAPTPPPQIASISTPSSPCWGALALCLCCFARLDGI